MRPTFRSKNEVIYDLIRQEIIKGVRQPGERLVIDDLAAEIGVSPIPVREALRQLEGDGFVIIEPYVGTTVTEIRADHISEVFALLEAMEIISGRAVCSQVVDDDLDTLERMIVDMRQLVDDPDSWSQENMTLHEFICERAGTPLVKKMLRNALDHWDRLRSYYLQDVFAHRVGAAQRDHEHMLTAIQNRDADAVEQVIRNHNRTALAAYTNYLEQHPDTTSKEVTD